MADKGREGDIVKTCKKDKQEIISLLMFKKALLKQLKNNFK